MDEHHQQSRISWYGKGYGAYLDRAIADWAPCPACPEEYRMAYDALAQAYRRLTEIPVEPHEPKWRIETELRIE